MLNVDWTFSFHNLFRVGLSFKLRQKKKKRSNLLILKDERCLNLTKLLEYFQEFLSKAQEIYVIC